MCRYEDNSWESKAVNVDKTSMLFWEVSLVNMGDEAVEIATEPREDPVFSAFLAQSSKFPPPQLPGKLAMVKESNLFAIPSTSDPVRTSKKRRILEEEDNQETSSEGLDAGSGDDLDSDMDPEQPHAVAWEDDEELDDGSFDDESEGESINVTDDEDDDARLVSLHDALRRRFVFHATYT